MESMSVRHQAPSSVDAEHMMWLARVNANSQSLSTPLSAFIASLPQLQQRQPRSSAERGKAFRERQRLYEEELEKMVGRLRKEVTSLQMRCQVRDTRSLNTPSSQSGSFVQVIHEYHRLFRTGLLEIPTARQPGQKRPHVDEHVAKKVALQEEFIRRRIDAKAVVGNMVGPEASIVQWRRYTQSHASLSHDVTSAEVSSVDDDLGTVTVKAHCNLHVRLSRDTFKMMFPHLLHDEPFLQKMIGKQISYASVKHFQFSHDGLIVVETVDVDFVGGFLDAGLSLTEITKLFAQAAITKDSMIVEVEQVAEVIPSPSDEGTSTRDDASSRHVDKSAKPRADSPRAAEAPSDSSQRLSVSFLLSDVSAA